MLCCISPVGTTDTKDLFTELEMSWPDMKPQYNNGGLCVEVGQWLPVCYHFIFFF